MFSIQSPCLPFVILFTFLYKHVLLFSNVYICHLICCIQNNKKHLVICIIFLCSVIFCDTQFLRSQHSGIGSWVWKEYPPWNRHSSSHGSWITMSHLRVLCPLGEYLLSPKPKFSMTACSRHLALKPIFFMTWWSHQIIGINWCMKKRFQWNIRLTEIQSHKVMIDITRYWIWSLVKSKTLTLCKMVIVMKNEYKGFLWSSDSYIYYHVMFLWKCSAKKQTQKAFILQNFP